MLWNKAVIAFEIRKPASKHLQPSSSPPGGPSDDDNVNGGDDNGGDGNGNASSPASSLGCSPPPNMSNPQGDTRGGLGNGTLLPSGPMGTGQCPPAPKKPTEEVEDKPAHLTIEEWPRST